MAEEISKELKDAVELIRSTCDSHDFCCDCPLYGGNRVGKCLLSKKLPATWNVDKRASLIAE